MNARDLVTLLMRIAGVVLIGFAIMPLFSAFVQKLNVFTNHGPFGSPQLDLFSWSRELKLLIQLGFGLYFLFGGKRLIRLLFRGLGSIEGACPHCGYDIRGIDSDRCPECGKLIRKRKE